METPRIFVSYSRADSEFVLKMAQDLKLAGIALWIDQFDIQAGERWDESVEQALDSCQYLLAILSPSSVASNNVMDEVAHALKSGKRVVPIVCQKCKIPFRLQRLEHVDFSSGYESALKKLLKIFTTVGPSPVTEEGPKRKTGWFLTRTRVYFGSRKRFILFIPVFVLLIIGGVYFWRALNTNSNGYAIVWVYGKVIDAKTQRPVAQADISVNNGAFHTFSGLDGRFAIENVPVGISLLRIDSKGYDPVNWSVALSQEHRVVDLGDIKVNPEFKVAEEPPSGGSQFKKPKVKMKNGKKVGPDGPAPSAYVITHHDVEAYLESASTGNAQIVLNYLDLQMPVDTQLAGSNTALATAVLAIKYDVAKILLEHHANPNIRTSTGSVPLIEASYAGWTDIVDLLIKSKADLNIRKGDGSGITALMFACIRGNTEIVRKLVEAGADPNIRNSNNTTAKAFANELASPKKEEIVAILNSVGAQ